MDAVSIKIRVSHDNPKNEDCMKLTMLLKYLNKFAISESLVPSDKAFLKKIEMYQLRQVNGKI